MIRRIYACLLLLMSLTLSAQRPQYGKLSPMLRELVASQLSVDKTRKAMARQRKPDREVCAFIRISDAADEIFSQNGCRSLAQFDDIYIASIPVSRLAALSLDHRVGRIEAGRGTALTLDTTAVVVNASPVYVGTSLPQAYTGKGVVVGIQDVGFDVTHPTFYNSAATEYRIKRFWDQLSSDSAQSSLYVGADYTTESDILTYAHSRDGLVQTHGTHTAGIAAGSGYDTKYRGMAYESDLCLVSNAVSSDTVFIPNEMYDKYTYATDVLGFKYIFDYADEVGKPCVVSFSEGSQQDFMGYDVLYNEALERLTGEGHILVASAGNNSTNKNYLHKPQGVSSAGAFLTSSNENAYYIVKSSAPFQMVNTVYGSSQEQLILSTKQVIAQEDSTLNDTLRTAEGDYIYKVVAYKSCYDADEIVYDVYVSAPVRVGNVPYAIEVVGETADIELYNYRGSLGENTLNPLLTAAVNTHNIFSPGCLSSVICVGATSYRTQFVNDKGVTQYFMQGADGVKAGYSSMGPTFDGRVKPEVMAPGSNVISSYSSYYLENNPNASAFNRCVERTTFNGRVYPWNANTGTSMSTPVVAGAIALWLEANPHLTPLDILGVFSRTCSHYDTTAEYPNNEYGYGQIDVYRGLLDILNLTGVQEISSHQPTATKIEVFSHQQLNITFDHPTTHAFSVRVYTVGGSLVLTKSFSAALSSCQLDMTALPKGVYAVQITGEKAITGSTLIRL